MARRRSRRDRPGNRYDPKGTWSDLKAQIEQGRPARAEINALVAKRERHLRRLVRAHVPVYLMVNGTNSLPINDQGNIGVPVEIWSAWIIRFCRALRMLRTLPSPPGVVPEEVGAGTRAGERILKLALSGCPRADVVACCTDALAHLATLREESVGRSHFDLPWGITRYFDRVAHWFWSSKEFMADGVVATGRAHLEIDAINAGACRPQLGLIGKTPPVQGPAAESEPGADALGEMMTARNLTANQQAMVRTVLEALEADGRDFIPRQHLRRLDLPAQTVDHDCNTNGRRGDKRGGGPTGGPASFRRSYLERFVRERWVPKLVK